MTAADRDSRPRRVYIDWARGLAVLIMIEAHTFDAWTRPADRATAAFYDAQILGGFAAPLFLWLAGVALVFSAGSQLRRSGSRYAAAESVCRRGLEIFILAFLFRLQAFIISPGSHPITLFRVDILNVMGPAIAFAGLVWGLFTTSAALAGAFAGLAFVIAMVAPLVRTWAFIGRLPIWVQWNIRPAGEYTTFTAFPWTGFVFAGAALGVLLAASRDRNAERRLHLALTLAGVLLVAVGFYTASLPSIYQQSSFWTSSPTYFAIRIGVMLIALSTLYAIGLAAERLGVAVAWLQRLGRSSLFVYWIHVELVYGYATWPLRHRLPLWGTGVAYVIFTVLMYYAVVGKDRIVASHRFRQATRQPVKSAEVSVSSRLTG